MSEEPLRLHLRYPPTPESAPRLAETIVAAAAEISGAHLDYSPGSLAAVDGIIEGFRREGLAVGNIAETLFCFGCYVGEVIVRRTGARWRLSDETPMKGLAGAPMVVELPGGNLCNPIGKVIKRLENGEVDSLVYFYQVFAKEHEKKGPGLLRRLLGR